MENCGYERVESSTAATAATVTLHCLAGCAVGEFIGLAIGVQLGLSALLTILLATTLAFITGFLFTLIPPGLSPGHDVDPGIPDRLAWRGRFHRRDGNRNEYHRLSCRRQVRHLGH